MVWFDVQCDEQCDERCDMLWCVVQCDIYWYGIIYWQGRYGMVWYHIGIVGYVCMVWYIDMVCYIAILWHGMAWHGMAWHGMVGNVCKVSNDFDAT